MPEPIPGPFKTEREAHAFAVEYGGPPEEGLSILGQTENHAMLLKACKDAGVQPGAYGERILGWLAYYEDAVCGVVAGLILSAHESGRRTDGT